MNLPRSFESRTAAYAAAIALAVVVVLLQWAIRTWVGDLVPFLFFLPALMFVAAACGRGPAFIVLLAGGLNHIYWAAPARVFAITRAEDAVALFAYLCLGTLLILYAGSMRVTTARVALAEGRLALAQEGTGVGVFELDFAARTAFVSPSLCEMLGQPVVQAPLPLDLWLAALDPEHVESSRRALREHVERGDLRYEREQRIELKNHEVRWLLHRVRIELDASGAMSAARGTTVDITSRKRAELALQALNESLEQQVLERTRERDRTWNNAQDLLLVVDLEGRFRETNPAWERVLGYRPDELVGHGHLEFIHPDDVALSTAGLERAAARTLRRLENRYRHKDGSYRWISWTAAPDGDLIYASGRDVTADREAAAELEAAQAQLRQAQKMEAVGQLTGGIAHDFNNLLQVVAGNLQLLSREIVGQEGAERRLGKALAATHRGAKLASQMLAFSRRQPLEPKVIDIGRFVAGMHDLLSSASGGAIRIETIVAAASGNARVDPVRLESAILNLAINARDAMDGSGTLTIEVGSAVLDAGDTAGRYVTIAVTDTGSGMTPDVIAQVFEPFFTTKPVGQGTGLGLSMVHGFVRQTGGQVRIDSVVGRGTTITLYLPRSEAGATAETAVDGAPAEGGSETVLLAEDDAGVRDIVIEMLRELGYRVVTADDAASALCIIESGAEVDLLLSDVVMPGPLSSIDLASRAKVTNPRLGVLFISGYIPENIIGDRRFETGLELLAKPFTREELAVKLRRALARRDRPMAG